MFQVVWIQAALNELATLWMQADSALRQAITTATQAIDQALQSDPNNQGESRPNGQRILFEFPLGVTFEVLQPIKRVRVLHVWLIRQQDSQ